MNSLLDRIVANQEQLLETAAAWQRPVVAMVERTAQLSAKLPKAPKLGSLPLLGTLPTPAELVEAQFGFVAKVIESNRRFVADLVKATEVPAPPAAS